MGGNTCPYAMRQNLVSGARTRVRVWNHAATLALGSARRVLIASGDAILIRTHTQKLEVIPMSDTGSFKVAIIGAGGISGAHSGAIKASGGRLTLTAAIDPHAENRGKLAAAHGAHEFAGVEEFLKARKAKAVDAAGVIVCTPPSARIKIVEQCLKAGLHVLTEKPIAHTLKDAKKLVSLAKKHKKLRTFVAYCHRFAPPVVRIKEQIGRAHV